LNFMLVRIWGKKNNDGRRILAYLLAICPILIVKKLKINVEQDRVVKILNIIKSLNVIFSVVKFY